MRSLPDPEGHPVDAHPANMSPPPPDVDPRGFAFLSNTSCKQEHVQLGVCCYRQSIREALNVTVVTVFMHKLVYCIGGLCLHNSEDSCVQTGCSGLAEIVLDPERTS